MALQDDQKNAHLIRVAENEILLGYMKRFRHMTYYYYEQLPYSISGTSNIELLNGTFTFSNVKSWYMHMNAPVDNKHHRHQSLEGLRITMHPVRTANTFCCSLIIYLFERNLFVHLIWRLVYLITHTGRACKHFVVLSHGY